MARPKPSRVAENPREECADSCDEMQATTAGRWRGLREQAQNPEARP